MNAAAGMGTIQATTMLCATFQRTAEKGDFRRGPEAFARRGSR